MITFTRSKVLVGAISDTSAAVELAGGQRHQLSRRGRQRRVLDRLARRDDVP